MASRISINIHGQNVKNTPRLLAWLQKLKPVAVLVMDNLGLAREIRQLLPNTKVVHRQYDGDIEIHKEFTPEEWLDAHIVQAVDGIYLYVMNEPKFTKEVIEWLVRLLKLAAQRRVRLVIGNWSVGNPQPGDWVLAKELLQLLDAHRDLFILGLHEYAGGVITSGLYGGYPDHAGVPAGELGGLNLIPPENWPQSVEDVTCYHMGRFKFLLDYCAVMGIQPPRIWITEHGFDDTSDIKEWENKLKVTKPYLNIRGWKTLQDQWIDWYGKSPLNWTPEQAYFYALRWANGVIYKNSVVECQMIFSWGFSSQMWEQFDIEDALVLQQMLVDYEHLGGLVPTPTPIPDNLGEVYEADLVTSTFINLRDGTSQQHTVVYEVPSAARVKAYPATKIAANGYDWYVVDYGKWRGWMALVGNRPFEAQFKKVESPPPPPPPPPPTEPALKDFLVQLTLRATTQDRADQFSRDLMAFVESALHFASRIREHNIEVIIKEKE